MLHHKPQTRPLILSGEETSKVQFKMVQLSDGYGNHGYLSDAVIGSTPAVEVSDVPQIQTTCDANGGSPGQSMSEDDIALIGMAIKFPEDATSTESFWKMLMDRRSALSDVPEDRYNIDAFWSPERYDT